MPRIVALDLGEARVGVAVSDPSQVLASPYTTLNCGRDEARLWASLQQIIAEQEAEQLVVGLPVSLDGQLHEQGRRVLAFVERLQQHLQIPVAFWDERLSTVEARRLLAEREEAEDGGRARRGRWQRGRGKQSKNRRGIDALAAAIILQEYLNHLNHLRQATEDA